MKSYSTVLSSASAEIVIEKSRFIGHSFHVEDIEETENIIKDVKKKYYDATHNCFAYIMGEDMSIAKANDDGEPSSTAGAPMLELLKKLNLTNTLVMATRYFGGIKLGASGLIRAYAKTAKISLEANSIVNKDVFNRIILEIDYSLIGRIQKFLENNQIIHEPGWPGSWLGGCLSDRDHEDFDQGVEQQFKVPFYGVHCGHQCPEPSEPKTTSPTRV